MSCIERNILKMANKRQRPSQMEEGSPSSKRQRTCKIVATPKGSRKIVDLIDDCLEHVFNCLDLGDLINVSNASTKLRRVATTVFASKYKGKELQIKPFENGRKCTKTPSVSGDVIIIYRPIQGFQIVRHFGNLIKKINIDLEISSESVPSETMELPRKLILCESLLAHVNKYCSESLQKFVLRSECWINLSRSSFSFDKPKKAYKNVEEVTIIGCSITGFGNTFPKMRRLELENIKLIDFKCIVAKHNNLEHLKLEGVFHLYPNEVKQIVRLNSQLKSFSNDECNLDFLRLINKKLTQLKDLEISLTYKYRNPKHLIHFESVENLKVHSNITFDWYKLFSFKQLKTYYLNGKNAGTSIWL